MQSHKCEGREGWIYNRDNPFCVKQCGNRYSCAHGLRYPETPTCDLVDELSKRIGVSDYSVAPYMNYRIRISVDNDPDIIIDNDGPARILVVL